MTDKHRTPGPWALEVTDTALWIGTPKGSKTDDIVCALDTGPEYKERFRLRQLANAKLIAAAPMLLEALQAMLSVYEELHARFDIGDCDATIQARAAIEATR